MDQKAVKQTLKRAADILDLLSVPIATFVRAVEAADEPTEEVADEARVAMEEIASAIEKAVPVLRELARDVAFQTLK